MSDAAARLAHPSMSESAREVVARAREAFGTFVDRMRVSDYAYRFSPGGQVSPFALCFAIFARHLVGDAQLRSMAPGAARVLRDNLARYRAERAATADVRVDKPFLQLLAFTLSALWILDELATDPLEEIVRPLIPDDMAAYLERVGALNGRPGSGNLAMFGAVLLIHARHYLRASVDDRLEAWVSSHLDAMNGFGFWGQARRMTYLQFQNAYHQYEILSYLGVTNPKGAVAAAAVSELADRNGHFAPYPGGGACYDYDAVFVLTGAGQAPRYEPLLLKTLRGILSVQNPDGGFGESRDVRPRTLDNLAKGLRHISIRTAAGRSERLWWFVNLQRPKHSYISTHWTTRGRRWHESNLWDSWFRMLTIARICEALGIEREGPWGFISYPGVGSNGGLERGASAKGP